MKRYVSIVTWRDTAFTLRVMLILLAKISLNAIAKCINMFMS